MANDFLNYQLRQSERATAFARYGEAAARLEVAQTREREAELQSQSFESVAKGQLFKTLGEINERERSIGLAFARYAAYGRCE